MRLYKDNKYHQKGKVDFEVFYSTAFASAAVEEPAKPSYQEDVFDKLVMV